MWNGYIKRCAHRCMITHTSTLASNHTRASCHTHPDIPAFFLWVLLPAFVERIPGVSPPLKTDTSVIALKVSFHIDPSAQIAIWTSRTRLFNVIYVSFYFPWVWGHTVERWEGEQATLCEYTVYFCSSEREKQPARGQCHCFWPAWWMPEQTHQVTQQVQTQVVHQNFQLMCFM